MSKEVKIWSYTPGSAGARHLADALGCKIIRHENSEFTGAPNKVVVNWGGTKVPEEVSKCAIINDPLKVVKIVKRHHLYKHLNNCFNTPSFTTDPGEAQDWIQAGAKVVEKDGTFSINVQPSTILRFHQVNRKIVHVQRKEGFDQPVYEGTKNMIKELVGDVGTLLKLHFCAVTIGWVQRTNMVYVLDVNTAPALDELLAKKYAEQIQLLIGK